VRLYSNTEKLLKVANRTRYTFELYELYHLNFKISIFPFFVQKEQRNGAKLKARLSTTFVLTLPPNKSANICSIHDFITCKLQRSTNNNGFRYIKIKALLAVMGVGRGCRGALAPLDFEIIGKEGCFFNFEGKNYISPLLAPLGTLFGKIHYCPPGKNLSDAHAGSPVTQDPQRQDAHLNSPLYVC